MGDPMKTEIVQVGTSIIEALRSGAQGWVLVKPLCERLGLDFSAQRRRLERQPWAVVAMMATAGADGKTYDMYCLDAAKVGMWLATIETKRIKDEQTKTAIGELQIKASEVLDRWLRGPEAQAAPPAPRFSGGDSPTELLIASMQHTLALAQQLRAVQAEQAQVGARLALVENKQRTAAQEIEPISPAQPELPGISKRQLVREHVNRYAAAMNMTPQDAWRLLYRHVDRRLGTRVYSYTLAKGETKLDRLEKLGLLEKVGKVCDTELQIPEERLRQLAAPVRHSGVYHA